MKAFKRFLCVLLVLSFVGILCACGGTPPESVRGAEETSAAAPEPTPEEAPAAEAEPTPEEAPAPTPEPTPTELELCAGEYTFLCARFSAAYIDSLFELGGAVADVPDQFVTIPDMEGETVTLKPDGTGYLYWGDDNQGPIDSWEIDGGALSFRAGVAEVEGTIAGGLMTLTIDDGFEALFAAPDADTADVEPISMAELASLLLAEEAGGETAAELPAEGEYEIFAVQLDGVLIRAGDLEIASTITLSAAGTGSMTSNDEAMDITEWTADGGTFSITMADGSSAGGSLHNGVIELDIYGNGYMILCYAQEGADTSDYAPMTLEEYQAEPESLLYALWASLDQSAGVHLSYDMHTDYMDADMSFDVHGKDGVYYSRRTTRVSGFENTMITFFRDGTAYNLYPEDMTGVIVTTTSSTVIAENILFMDDLLSDIRSCALRKDFVETQQELEGVSYTVDLYPATDESPDTAFYFTADGQLAFCYKGAPVIETAVEIGETVYTVYAIDEAVNEELFDISAYELG